MGWMDVDGWMYVWMYVCMLGRYVGRYVCRYVYIYNIYIIYIYEI